MREDDIQEDMLIEIIEVPEDRVNETINHQGYNWVGGGAEWDQKLKVLNLISKT